MFTNPILEALLEEVRDAAPDGHMVALHYRVAWPMFYSTEYPETWQEIYTAKLYAFRDPVVIWAFANTGVTRWSEITLPDPFGVLAHAREYGMKYGMVGAIGPKSSRSTLGAIREDREFTDGEMDRIYRILQRMHDALEPPRSLSPGQVEALRCIAEGHRISMAAGKIGISESALKARLNGARQKLSARSTGDAIKRAREFGLI